MTAILAAAVGSLFVLTTTSASLCRRVLASASSARPLFPESNRRQHRCSIPQQAAPPLATRGEECGRGGGN
jgi:hypothetical protein